eukprot:3294084-Alexandrium_andersonii.AAC.1
MRGPSPSSTRAEAAALLACLYLEAPLCVASDSANVVRRMKQVTQGRTAARPLHLMPDGDIWTSVQTVAEQRGLESVRIVKCKGHATVEHLRRGDTDQWAMDGNQAADRLAERGRLSAPDSSLVRRYVDRHRARLVAFCFATNSMMLDIFKAVVKLNADPMRSAKRKVIGRFWQPRALSSEGSFKLA